MRFGIVIVCMFVHHSERERERKRVGLRGEKLGLSLELEEARPRRTAGEADLVGRRGLTNRPGLA